MNSTFSFIGTGNMGGAILKAACGIIDPDSIYIADSDRAKALTLGSELGCNVMEGNLQAVESADFVILCVKPQIIGTVLDEIAPVLRKREADGNPAVLVSIAAGVSISKMRSHIGAKQPIVRVMPNTPALIGKGLMIIAGDDSVRENKIAALEQMLSCCGETMRLSENLMDQATTASSCSPAFVYLFIEALADAGVYTGLTRENAEKMAASAVLGAASMVLETGMKPGELKDMVSSPNGSTIRGVASLEKSGFRGAVIKAFLAAYERNTEMGK
ncbi:MAG: pyrroline-5-carboxylate reductase [Clostridiales bacterium]|nr:pyrroline-5-carboxylate reductase [Clostridiales bacterium]